MADLDAVMSDTRLMTTATTKIDRTGPAIRAALAASAPDERAKFENEFKEAAEQAGATFDVNPLDRVLDRWWRIAVARTNALSAREQEQLRRAKAGDYSGMLARDEHGNWVQL